MRLPLLCGFLMIPLLASAENLLKNSAFTELNEHGHPKEWRISNPVHLERHSAKVSVEEEIREDQTIRFLRIEKKSPSENLAVGDQEIVFPEGTTAIRIRARMRGRDLVAGNVNWHVAGVALTFLFDDGSARPGIMSKWIRMPEMNSDWAVYETVIPVRDDATRASLAFVAQGWKGVHDIHLIHAEAIRNELPH